MIEIKGGEIYTNGHRVLFPRDGNFSPSALLIGIDQNDDVALVKLTNDGKLITSGSSAINNVTGDQDLSVAPLAFTSAFGLKNKQFDTIAISISTSKLRNVYVYARDTVLGVDYTLLSQPGTTAQTFILTSPLKLGPDFEIKLAVSQGPAEDGTATYTVMEEDI